MSFYTMNGTPFLPGHDRAAAIRATLYPAGTDRAAVAPRLVRFIETERESEIVPAAGSPLAALGRELYRKEVLLDRCAEIVASDAGLAHTVLRAANHAALGSRTFTIPYAVLFLGLTRLRLVFGVEVLRRMNSGRLSEGWLPFWERSLYAARLVERLAAHYHPADGTEYLAGLLHDAAWPAVAGFFKREYGASFDAPEAIFPLEREVFGTSHAAISAAMCLRCGVPDHVVEAVARHADAELPDAASVRSFRYHGAFLGVLLRIAGGVADCFGFPRHGKGPHPADIVAATATREVAWLASFGPLPDIEALAHDELRQSRKIVGLFAS